MTACSYFGIMDANLNLTFVTPWNMVCQIYKAGKALTTKGNVALK